MSNFDTKLQNYIHNHAIFAAEELMLALANVTVQCNSIIRDRKTRRGYDRKFHIRNKTTEISN